MFVCQVPQELIDLCPPSSGQGVLLWAVLTGERRTAFGVVRARPICLPSQQVAFIDHKILHVWSDVPDGLYSVAVADTKLRALRSDGKWIITGRV
jgi:hypothetical protein